MAPASKIRRWFRFGLWAMFVLVTVVALWLAYEVRWMRAREAFIADEGAAREEHREATWWSVAVAVAPGQPPMQAPGMLALLGEQGYAGISFLAESPTMRQLTDRDRQRLATARRLFPEAQISAVHLSDTSDENGVGSWVPD
jgi:hypothetical protein